ncbi:ergosterol biosynthesis protein [Tilletia horrida]|uniref:Ergosterol biosynthesis protein n=1 Tax=Tilletia horrida TaxID=155126 RepID=A0AAN6JVB8_9BASI|nr:ergosterol biosynthesis protein [Tilletia horrida]KAK0544294.1 ergosterol biosynthesis protein [Tilletia horrida]KAK0560416.1 ergosterol biosynthesis protein [Tilletia horrida]
MAVSSSSAASWVPDGNLPKWLLFVSVLAIFNCVSNYLDYNFSRKVYARAPLSQAQVTPLSARTFGVWNFTSALIRTYCAYNMHSRPVYELCMWSYVIALAHFGSEVAVYKTAKMSAGIISPFIVASVSLGAMVLQYKHYIG